MRRAIVTGAAGFVGCNLVERLVQNNYFVYAIVRHGSAHNTRLSKLQHVLLADCEMEDYVSLAKKISASADVFFHLAWQGARHDFSMQYTNIGASLRALEAAVALGCKRFICTGSQAEYGVQTSLTTEDTMPHPLDAYGAAKLAACTLTRERARELNIEWVWGRIFSLYGKYEPTGRMLPDLVKTLKADEIFHMTAATQMWDYLYSTDGAEALVALAERGHAGEIYNIANGNVRPLREFTDEVRRLIGKGNIVYGDSPKNVSAIYPSVEKIQRDTGWRAEVTFSEGISRYIGEIDNMI